MKISFTFALLLLSTICFAQNEKRAEIIDVEGIILFKYVPDNMFEGFYCSLKTTIIIDSIEYDFISSNDTNYNIIRENKALEQELGEPDKYLTGNLESNLCIYRTPDITRIQKFVCDSIIKVYKQNNIYDTLLYKPDLTGHMTLTISSNSIFSSNNSDTTYYIALSFTGTVIKYDNLIYREQTDYRTITLNVETEKFDDSHGTCPFEKLDSTFIVLNNVSSLGLINEKQIAWLKLIKSELTEVKIFLHE